LNWKSALRVSPSLSVSVGLQHPVHCFEVFQLYCQ
jgi:hypothetical protein